MRVQKVRFRLGIGEPPQSFSAREFEPISLLHMTRKPKLATCIIGSRVGIRVRKDVHPFSNPTPKGSTRRGKGKPHSPIPIQLGDAAIPDPFMVPGPSDLSVDESVIYVSSLHQCGIYFSRVKTATLPPYLKKLGYLSSSILFSMVDWLLEVGKKKKME